MGSASGRATVAAAMTTEKLLSADELRSEVKRLLPYAPDWLDTPHELLSGDTPEQRILAGDLESVQNLLYSIFTIGAI